MTVPVVGVVDVGAPFQQLPVASYAVGHQVVCHVLPLLCFFGVDMEQVCGLDGVGQQFAHHGMHECGSFVHVTVFG